MSCCGKTTKVVAKGAQTAAKIARGPWLDRSARRDRLAICRACSLHRIRYRLDWCGEPYDGTDRTPDQGCGCVIVLKARLAAERCPLGRWPA